MEPNITKHKNVHDFRVTLGVRHNFSMLFISF